MNCEQLCICYDLNFRGTFEKPGPRHLASAILPFVFTVILGLQPRDKAAMLVVNTKEIFLLNLHQNRLHFPAERNAFVLDHQHGRRDVTCKPAIHSAIFLQYKIRCFGQFWLRSDLRSGVFFAEKERLIVGELLLTASQFEADCTGLRARQSGTRVNEICRGLTRFPEC